MAFVMPSIPSYMNSAGQAIYWIAGANIGKRGVELPKYLVLHHTAGTDSRAYLQKNKLGVSAHYLCGSYPDTGPNPVVLKYAGETDDVTYTQGYSTIGTVNDPNPWCISIELEGPPIDPAVQQAGADLAGAILRYWSDRGVDLLLLRHKDIDRQGKIDPTLDWTWFCRRAYGGML